MTKLTKKERQSGQQYMKEFWPPMIAYMVILLGGQAFLRHNPETLWGIPLALAPLVPIFFIGRSIVRFIGRMDEFQKKIFMEAATFTLLVLILSAFAYGFLEGQGFPHLDMTLVAIMICLLYLVIFVFVRRKYHGE